MKKTILTLIAVIAFIPMANAQFYGVSTTGRGGQINLYGGVASTSASPLFMAATVYSDSWGQTWTDWTEVECDKITPSVGASFLITASTLRDNSERFRSGIFLGVGYTMSQWKADFSSLISGLDYSLWAKASLLDIQAGYEGSVKPNETISIDFDIAPYIMFQLSPRTRTERSMGGTLVANGDNAEWHEGEKFDDFASAPSIDLGAIARVSANYHFTETMWAGLAFQYRIPFANFADIVSSDYSHDGFRYADDYLMYSDIKHRGWSLMLSFGINFD